MPAAVSVATAPDISASIGAQKVKGVDAMPPPAYGAATTWYVNCMAYAESGDYEGEPALKAQGVRLWGAPRIWS
jgi:hypothetical protein